MLRGSAPRSYVPAGGPAPRGSRVAVGEVGAAVLSGFRVCPWGQQALAFRGPLSPQTVSFSEAPRMLAPRGPRWAGPGHF